MMAAVIMIRMEASMICVGVCECVGECAYVCVGLSVRTCVYA